MAATSPDPGGAIEAAPVSTLVVPLDDSDFAARAVPVARAIAHKLGGSVLLAPSSSAQARGDDYVAGFVRDEEVATAVAPTLAEPAEQSIQRLVHDAPGRTLCMSTHGRGAFGWAILGSFAEEVVCQHDEPLILVGRHCRDDWVDARRMLVCVDCSSAADPIVPAAIRWAKDLRLDVQVAHVIHPLDVEGATHPDPVVGAIVAEFDAAGVHAVPRVLRGSHVAGAIANQADAEPAALIAMNTHGRSGLARVALGSVAMGTVGLAPCPVLIAPMPR